jgi:hypothetical protein
MRGQGARHMLAIDSLGINIFSWRGIDGRTAKLLSGSFHPHRLFKLCS